MTSRPDASRTADAVVAVTMSPFLFFRELIESVAVSSMLVPSATDGVAGRAGGGGGVCRVVVGGGVRRAVCFGCAAIFGWSAAGRSLMALVDSAGARLRSRVGSFAAS